MVDTCFLRAARTIGDRILRQAIWKDNECTWEVVRPDLSQRSALRPIRVRAGGELYGGASGIALFLGVLYESLGEERFGIAAEGGMRYAIRLAAEMTPGTLGFYSGAAGIAYAAARLFRILRSEEWHRGAIRTIESLADVAERDRTFDVIGGGAGDILALVRVSQLLDSDAALSIARAFGDRLLRARVSEVRGWSWPVKGAYAFVRPLLGFAHGAAGVGLALTELYSVTSDEAYCYGAQQAFAYERGHFDENEGNWPDLREPEISRLVEREHIDELKDRVMAGWQPSQAFMVAWCHGAPGIGLSRLRAYDILRAPVLLDEATAAINTTKLWIAKHGRSGQTNFSLCHGITGNCELLLHGAETLGDRSLRSEVEGVLAEACERFDNSEAVWPCGTLQGLPDPGLLVGEAGIGYSLLRVHGVEAESPLLPCSPSPKIAPQVFSDVSQRLAMHDVESHFGRTLEVWRRLNVDIPQPSLLGDIPAFARKLQERVSLEPNGRMRAWLGDAMKGEVEQLRLAELRVRPVSVLVDRLLRGPFPEAEKDSLSFCSVDLIKVVRVSWDWEDWLERGGAAVEPTESGIAFIARIIGNRPQLHRISRLGALVLEALGEPGSIDDVLDRVSELVSSDIPIRQLRIQVIAQMRTAWDAGLVKQADESAA